MGAALWLLLGGLARCQRLMRQVIVKDDISDVMRRDERSDGIVIVDHRRLEP
jgi:hypothetical protein